MNIYDYAMQIEENGEEYYRKIAKKTEHKGVKRILLMLARDEEKHYNIFKKLKEEQNDVEMQETNVLEESKDIFISTKMNEKDIELIDDKDEKEMEMYKKAKEIEKKSMDFYKEKAEEVKQEKQKKILLNIAEEEKKHYHIYDNLTELLLRPRQWVEDAEFYHLEDY